MDKNSFKEIYELFGGYNEEIFNRLCEDYNIKDSIKYFKKSKPQKVHSGISEEDILRELETLTYLDYDNIFS